MIEKNNKKVINAWATYDLANSVYNLVITAAIFPIYYASVSPEIIKVFGIGIHNTSLYDFALAFAYMVIVCIAPLLSGIADYGGSKKRFMQFFCYFGATACSLMFFFDSHSIWWGIWMAIFACIGFSGSLVFYNAFLPEIADPEHHDHISAKGFARGYWGSSILLVLNLLMITFHKQIGFENAGQATRVAFLTVGVWWIGFAQIPFKYLPNNPYGRKPEGRYLLKGYQELRKVWFELKENKKLTRFLTAFFIYSMGVQTIMLVANHFGLKEIKNADGTPMSQSQLILTILIIQFVAIAGAHLFSYISKQRGNIFTLKIATLFWAFICVFTFFFVFTPVHFFITAGFVGLVMGGIQALSRSTYSKMLPETIDHASYFSFYDITEKLSIVFGMILFGITNQVTDTMRTPILLLIVFFVCGFLLLMRLTNLKTEAN